MLPLSVKSCASVLYVASNDVKSTLPLCPVKLITLPVILKSRASVFTANEPVLEVKSTLPLCPVKLITLPLIVKSCASVLTAPNIVVKSTLYYFAVVTNTLPVYVKF